MFELAERSAPAGRALRRGRRRPARRHRRLGVAGLDCMAFHAVRRAVAGSCRWSASRRAAASPATPRCSAAATWSSPRANSNIGMGGPAMIEGGGLGVFRPEEIGPMRRAGAERRRRHRRRRRGRSGRGRQAVPRRTSRGRVPSWTCADQRLLRSVVPENRLRVYDVRQVIDDARRHRLGARAAARTSGSAWSPRSCASRAGRSASSPTTRRTSPARSTADGADKAARFMQLCDAFDICRSCSCATRRASWSAPRSRRPRSCGTPRACS